MKVVRELPGYAVKARRQGFKISEGKNGGGWIRLAIDCGMAESPTREASKQFIRQLFDPRQPARTPVKVSVLSPSIKNDRSVPWNQAIMGNEFLSSYEWRVLRMRALKLHGARCQCCGDSPANGAVMNVDHIKPRRLFPELALDLSNLQVLCSPCNHGKSNWDMTDWRDKEPELAEHERESMRAMRGF